MTGTRPILVAALLALAPGAALAQADRACDLGAFVNDPDPRGLALRAGPSAGAAAIGRLPGRTRNADDPAMIARIEVRVVEARNGWFRVVDATDNPELTGRPERRLAQRAGWVSGRLLTVKSQAAVGRSAPARGAPVVARLDDASFDAEAFMVGARLLDCRGLWALVEYRIPTASPDLAGALRIERSARAGAGAFRVWVDRICAIQETSCDMGE